MDTTQSLGGDVLATGLEFQLSLWAGLKLQAGFCSSGGSETSGSEGMTRVQPYDPPGDTSARFLFVSLLLCCCSLNFLLRYSLHFRCLSPQLKVHCLLACFS